MMETGYCSCSRPDIWDSSDSNARLCIGCGAFAKPDHQKKHETATTRPHTHETGATTIFSPCDVNVPDCQGPNIQNDERGAEDSSSEGQERPYQHADLDRTQGSQIRLLRLLPQ